MKYTNVTITTSDGPSYKLNNGWMTRRQRFNILTANMYNDRSSFIPAWRELGEYIKPRRPRFTVTDNDRGERRNGKIIDSTATLAIRTTASGMMGGITSPARPWMRLDTETPHDAQSEDVKNWLEITTERMLSVFLRSNLYNSLPMLYSDMAQFGTAAMLIEEDPNKIFRTQIIPIGSYMIAVNHDLKVDTFYREFQYTVAQLLETFGYRDPATGRLDFEHFNWENFSPTVRNMYDTNQMMQKFTVCHIVLPNDLYEPGKLGWRGKKYSSHYYEQGTVSSSDFDSSSFIDDIFLRESGYDEFPFLVPRWETTGEDAYGTDCPGSTAIGDIKQLQLMQRRKMQAIDYKLKPPMTGPSSLRKAKTSILPGDITYQDVRDGQQGFRPTYQVQFDITELKEDIQETQQRIKRAFYEDLFLMMSSQEQAEPITATEVTERHEEKLLALGPVLEQLNQDVLNPLIDIVFAFMVKQGRVPTAPPQLHGQPLRVEYTSIMAEAQKLLGISSLERFAHFYLSLVPVIPSVADVVNSDELILNYADKTSVANSISRTPEQIAMIRQQRQQAQAQQAQQQAKMQASETAKNMSQADMSGDNALTRLMQQGNAGNMVPQQ